MSPVSISPQEIVLIEELAVQLLALIRGGKTAEQVLQELRDGIATNNKWLVDHGFQPVGA